MTVYAVKKSVQLDNKLDIQLDNKYFLVFRPRYSANQLPEAFFFLSYLLSTRGFKSTHTARSVY